MTRARDLADGIFEQATGGVLKLETSDTTVTDGSVLGKIEFKAPDEASGTDAILVGAAIEAVAEATFAADNNATELVFKTGASAAADTKMTLTSGGNLLVGGTAYEGSSNSNASSAFLGSNGFISSNVTDDFGMQVNRTGTDGALFNGRKNGSDVGSIGTKSGGMFIGSDDAGIFFNDHGGGDDDALFPYDVGTNTFYNGHVDIGGASNRFRNLYLSGGVHLGGTGAANKLNDYEEGTFTIGFTGASFSLGNATGIYTKVGDKVTFAYYSGASNISSASGNAILTGLPFTVRNSDNAYTPFFTSHNTFFGGVANTGTTGHVSANATTGRFMPAHSTTVSSFVNGNSKYIMITGTYFTDS